jgi:lipopolysaccharide/colanic/teichoic acid biosynthesis glycosyltransferase
MRTFLSQRVANEVERKARRSSYETVKRSMDVAISAVVLVLAAPMMIIIAITIKLDSPGPALFVQYRVGKEGRPFRMYKFRTMVDGAEAMRADLVRERGLTEPVLKFRHDPRITRVGRFLRRWSLDELPQIVNVLKGEMSLVGPRPEEQRVVSMYSPWHRQRLCATPGITGPMQVSGRADLSLDERVQIELDYINRASLWEDIRLLLLTFPAVISGDGSY